MEPTYTEEVNFHTLLYQLFGSTRAEWLGEKLYDLFAEPSYFPELQTNRPCILVGGRGTGKTTALKGLSYEGQAALRPTSDPREWRYFGIYHRVDTNRVTAFIGEELTEDQWCRLFGHYLNLTIVLTVLIFLDWFERKTDTGIVLPEDELELVVRSLGIRETIPNLQTLRQRVRLKLVDFEANINTIADEIPRDLSLVGVPIDQLISALKEAP